MFVLFDFMKTMIQKAKSGGFPCAAQNLFGASLLAFVILALSGQTSYARIEATRIATGLALPLYVCAPPGDTGRIFTPTAVVWFTVFCA